LSAQDVPPTLESFLQGSNLLSNLVEFLVISLMMQDPLLEEGEKNQANDHVENENQEQLKLPMRSIGEQCPKCLVFHRSLLMGMLRRVFNLDTVSRSIRSTNL